jgi:hypothetical protein
MRGFKKPDSESGFFCKEYRWDVVLGASELGGCYCIRRDGVAVDANFIEVTGI